MIDQYYNLFKLQQIDLGSGKARPEDLLDLTKIENELFELNPEATTYFLALLLAGDEQNPIEKQNQLLTTRRQITFQLDQLREEASQFTSEPMIIADSRNNPDVRFPKSVYPLENTGRGSIETNRRYTSNFPEVNFLAVGKPNGHKKHVRTPQFLHDQTILSIGDEGDLKRWKPVIGEAQLIQTLPESRRFKKLRGQFKGFKILHDDSVIAWGPNGFIVHWIWENDSLVHNTTFDTKYHKGNVGGVLQLNDGSLLSWRTQNHVMTHWVWNGVEFEFDQYFKEAKSDPPDFDSFLDPIQGIESLDENTLIVWDKIGFNLWFRQNGIYTLFKKYKISKIELIQSMLSYQGERNEIHALKMGADRTFFTEIYIGPSSVVVVWKMPFSPSLLQGIQKLEIELDNIDQQLKALSIDINP